MVPSIQSNGTALQMKTTITAGAAVTAAEPFHSAWDPVARFPAGSLE
jgi:hypothetical protein